MISLYDAKIFIQDHNKDNSFERQTIKYMGNDLPDKDITFDEKNWKRNLMFDIIIKEKVMKVLMNDKVNFDDNWYVVSTLIGKNCWIIPLLRNNIFNETHI